MHVHCRGLSPGSKGLGSACAQFSTSYEAVPEEAMSPGEDDVEAEQLLMDFEDDEVDEDKAEADTTSQDEPEAEAEPQAEADTHTKSGVPISRRSRGSKGLEGPVFVCVCVPNEGEVGEELFLAEGPHARGGETPPRPAGKLKKGSERALEGL